jgi:hypothetical protein
MRTGQALRHLSFSHPGNETLLTGISDSELCIRHRTLAMRQTSTNLLQGGRAKMGVPEAHPD